MTKPGSRGAANAPAGAAGVPAGRPDRDGRGSGSGDDARVACPFCGSPETELMSLFGSSPLTSQYYCRNCRTAFERVKWGGQPPRG